ncbi:MAG: IS110 family transposase [Solirubrobacteraceae bacterium]
MERVLGLKELGVTHVAMESSGVYWKPVYYVLEDEYELLLVNAQHVKNLPGRNTDMKDAEWLCQLIKFIEDDFLHGQRLDPRTDGRPDPRSDIREVAPQLGDLTADFDFNQTPLPPLILPLHPPPGPASKPRG